jgi:hypothetical protein
MNEELLQESIWELGEALIERRDLGRVEVDDPIVNEHIEVS